MQGQCGVIILAGGKGKRLNQKIPKQFLLLRKKPLIYYAIHPFSEFSRKDVVAIVVVVPHSHVEVTRRIVARYFARDSRLHIISGGKHRIHSYIKGIDFFFSHPAPVSMIIAHDAARPLLRKKDVSSLRKIFIGSRADALLVTRSLPESLFRKKRRMDLKCLSRQDFFLGQSPNFFTMSILVRLRKIFAKYQRQFSEALDIVELISAIPESRVIGASLSHSNLKVTRHEDLLIAETLLKNRHSI